jgi:hypothetical protein
MKLLVTGGRNFYNYEMVYTTLDMLHKEDNITLLIHGDAQGADRLCAQWAKLNNIEIVAYPADWDIMGKAAGVIRNSAMLLEKPDVLVVFPGGKGTADMVNKALKAGIKIVKAQE